MEAKVKVPIANANAGILFRVQDANNYYMYRINVNDKKLELFKAVNGTLTPCPVHFLPMRLRASGIP